MFICIVPEHIVLTNQQKIGKWYDVMYDGEWWHDVWCDGVWCNVWYD